MDGGSITGVFTEKLGPLAGWQWAGLVGVGALALMTIGKKKAIPGAAQPDSTGDKGQFSSTQSQETVDPVTGERRSSSYQATGSNAGWGGQVGLPMAYPMPYSGGDVYVNLPGDTQNLNPGHPVYPPKQGLGQVQGQVGGYWWTPMGWDDVVGLPARAGLSGGGDLDAFKHMDPQLRNAIHLSYHWSQIMAANPQIDWSANPRSLIGKAMYIPPGSIDTGTIPWWSTRAGLPPGAQWNAPADYNPPQQQTSVNNG
jgi:hypothetical protein